MLLAVALFLSGCGQPGPLSPEERAQVAADLWPRFERVHGPVLDGESIPTDGLRAALDRLLDAAPERESTATELVVTAEADPDALCLPGDRVVIARGLLAFVTSEDEAAAALASALVMCPRVDAIWRAAESASLPVDEPESMRMLRYIEIRLEANALLYRVAVADACSGACGPRITSLLERAGFDAAALRRLATRVAAVSPEALWLERIGLSGDLPVAGAENLEGPDWSGLSSRREGLVALAEVRREIGRGRLINAYQAILDARRLLEHEPHAKLIQAELELHNNHPFYTRDLLLELQRAGHPVPDENYLRGWMQTQEREWEEATELLPAAMDDFPRVAGLYQFAVLKTRERDYDAAETLLARASAAGSLSAYTDEIQWLVDHIEKRRARGR